MTKALSMAFALMLAACNPEQSCSERDISDWIPSGSAAIPIRCETKVVGYSLDIDGASGARVFQLQKAAPLLTSGSVSVSADIDLLTPEFGAVQRRVKISRGMAVYAESSGGLQTLKAQAIVISASDPLVFDVTVSVPIGTHYIGQIRNLQF